MKKIISVFIVFFMCLFMMSIAFAEKQEWVDKTFDFSKIRRVTFYPPNVPDRLKNGIAENQIAEIYPTKIKLPAHVQHILLAKVVENIKADTGMDLDAIGAKNPTEAINLLKENGSKYVDLIIFPTVTEYRIGSAYFEGYTYNTTSYQTSYVYGSGGSTAVQTPVTTTHSVPGGIKPVAYASVQFDVFDLQKGKNTMTRLDERFREASSTGTKPKDLFGRILESFIEDFSQKLEKGK